MMRWNLLLHKFSLVIHRYPPLIPIVTGMTNICYSLQKHWAPLRAGVREVFTVEDILALLLLTKPALMDPQCIVEKGTLTHDLALILLDEFCILWRGTIKLVKLVNWNARNVVKFGQRSVVLKIVFIWLIKWSASSLTWLILVSFACSRGVFATRYRVQKLRKIGVNCCLTLMSWTLINYCPQHWIQLFPCRYLETIKEVTWNYSISDFFTHVIPQPIISLSE